MAKVIEFYVPKSFRSAFVRPAQPGKVIEFDSRPKKSVAPRPAGGVLAWLLEGMEPNRAAGSA